MHYGMPTRRLVTLLMAALLLMGASAVVQAGTVPAAGLIAHWAADGDTTESIASRDGTSVGAGFQTGKFGQAFDLGTSGYVTVPDDAIWTFGGDFTISLWAKWTSLAFGSIGQPEDVLISHDDGGRFQNKWFFGKGGGKVNFHLNSTSGNSVFLAQTPFTPTLDAWHNLVVRRSGTTYQILIDGAPGTPQVYGGAIQNASHTLNIGEGEGFRFEGGGIDDVAIYNRALSNAEILDINRGPSGSTVPLPTAAWMGLGMLLLLCLRTRFTR